jgi:hypothetical protein
MYMRTRQLTDLIAIVSADQTSSQQRWEAAIESEESGRDWQALADTCDTAYDDAIAAIAAGDLAGAEAALITARMAESDGGDNCDAAHALRAVRTGGGRS